MGRVVQVLKLPIRYESWVPSWSDRRKSFNEDLEDRHYLYPEDWPRSVPTIESKIPHHVSEKTLVTWLEKNIRNDESRKPLYNYMVGVAFQFSKEFC